VRKGVGRFYFSTPYCNMSFYGFCQGLCQGILPIIFKIQIEGMENIPDDRGIILCCNHRTYLDPIFLGLRLKRKLCFMAKEEMFRKPGLGWLVKELGAFPLKRGTGDTKAIENAIQAVQNGGVFAIFPEGTRSKTGELLKPKSGAVLIAAKTGGDIIPCCIKYEEKVRFRSKVSVTYGEVIKNEELGLENVPPVALKESSKFMMSKIAALYGDGRP